MTARIAIFILAGSTCLSAAFADPSAEGMLKLVPVMEGISVDTPEAKQTNNLIVRNINTNKASGWQLLNEDRVVLRRFLDTNGDKRIDRWIYFLDGQEVYSDADTDHDGIADTAIRRFQLTKDKHGKLVVASGQKSSVTTPDEPPHALAPATGLIANGGTQVRVNITLYEESADETSRLRARPDKKVLAEPDIVVTLGRPFSTLVGGKLGGKNGGDGLEFGTGVQGKIERLGPDTLLVRLRLSLGTAVSIKKAPEIQLVRTTSFEVRAPMTIGKVTRIPCGESQTLEIELVGLPAGDLTLAPDPATDPAPGGVSSPTTQ